MSERRRRVRLRKIDPEGPAYDRWLVKLALMILPPTEPCERCGRPTVEGYQCEFCQPRNGKKVKVVA